jgi:asparagine synthase (glutamine-hydrolysing)
MFDFLALAWNPADKQAEATAARAASGSISSRRVWTNIFVTDGFSLWVKPPLGESPQPILLPQNRGVVLGVLFERVLPPESPRRLLQISADAAAKIVGTQGRYLVEKVWGSYVAFIIDRDTRCTSVLRDCSGKIPCFTSALDGVSLFYSDISFVLDVAEMRLTVDWRYIATFMSFNDLQIRDSALKEVSEVLAGERVVCSPFETRRSFVWNPTAVCFQDRIEDPTEAAVRLRETTFHCVRAWSQVYSRVLHNLSGGFDSAVVLAALATARGNDGLTCLNRYHGRAGEDERTYARLAAERVKVRLIERTWDDGMGAFGNNLASLPIQVKPTVASLFDFLDLRLINRLATEEGVDSLWTGQGGDHIFLKHHTVLAVSEFIRRNGISSGLMSVMRDACKLTRSSYWHILVKTVPRETADWIPDFFAKRGSPFLPRGFAGDTDLISYGMHPWHDLSATLPRVKREQVLLYGDLLNRHPPLYGVEVAPQHHPLLSQPLLELCLQIPAYVLLGGGKPRALARIAFRRDLPRQIVNRESKGGTTSYVTGLFRRNLSYVRELLLDGRLRQEGMLDIKVLEPYLLASRPIHAEEFFPILACLAAEIWARKWEKLAPLRIAA